MQREKLCRAQGRRWQTPAGNGAIKQPGSEGCDNISRVWVTEPESDHRSVVHTSALQTWAMGCVGRALNSNARLCNKLLLFLRFSGGKAVCASHLSLGQGTFTEEGSHARQVPRSPQTSASLPWQTKGCYWLAKQQLFWRQSFRAKFSV